MALSRDLWALTAALEEPAGGAPAVSHLRSLLPVCSLKREAQGTAQEQVLVVLNSSVITTWSMMALQLSSTFWLGAAAPPRPELAKSPAP